MHISTPAPAQITTADATARINAISREIQALEHERAALMAELGAVRLVKFVPARPADQRSAAA